MTFDQALIQLKAGLKIRRRSWHKGVFYFKKGKKIFIQKGDDGISCINDEFFEPVNSAELLATNWEIVK